MNIKQEKFINEYIKEGNATKAAINAGYSKRSARSTANRMLTNAYIKNEIDHLRAELKASLALSYEKRQSILAKIATTDHVNGRGQPDFKPVIAAITEYNRMDGLTDTSKLVIIDHDAILARVQELRSQELLPEPK